jgi:hypothetical protein
MSVKPKRHQAPRREFTVPEDVQLRYLVSLYGDSDWARVAAEMSGRSKRQCRERWRHYLSPDLKTDPFTEEEDQRLREGIKAVGQRWLALSSAFPGRTDTSLKNRWNVLVRSDSAMSAQQQRSPRQLREGPCAPGDGAEVADATGSNDDNEGSVPFDDFAMEEEIFPQ